VRRDERPVRRNLSDESAVRRNPGGAGLVHTREVRADRKRACIRRGARAHSVRCARAADALHERPGGLLVHVAKARVHIHRGASTPARFVQTASARAYDGVPVHTVCSAHGPLEVCMRRAAA